MSLSSLGLIAILAAAPVNPEPIRFVRVDPHRAALFLANVFRVHVIVVGGTSEPVTIGIKAATAEGALRELAQASGLSLAVEGKRFLMAPAESLAARERLKALSGGRAITLSFQRAEASQVVELLGRADDLSIVGSLEGRVSLAMTNVPSREVLSSLVGLAGQEAKVQGRTVTLSGAGALPATAERTGEGCPGESLWDLACVPASALEVCGTAMVGSRSAALMRRRGAGAGSRLSAVVRNGSRVGEPPVKVASVDSDGVALADGTRLPLGGPVIRDCTEATLRSFSPAGGGVTHESLAPEKFEWVDPNEAATKIVPCLVSESDAECDTRARQVALATHVRHRIVSSVLDSDTDGVLARFQVDGRVVEHVARSHEEVAQLLRDEVARGGKATLLSSETRRDPRTRRAVIQLQHEEARVEQRTRERVRVQWTPGTEAVEAVRAAQQLAERSGLILRELPRQGETVRVVVGCP